MQVTVESTSDLGRKMKVQVPAERIDSEVEKRLRSMAQQVRIHGFRPGKVPLKVVRQRYGRQVLQEVRGEVLQNSYQEAIVQERLRPVGGPEIHTEPLGAEQGLEYTATFEVYPELEVAPVEGLEIRRPVVEITDDDVEQMIETLRRQGRSWEAVEREAREGDRVSIDFRGTLDGEVFDGGEAEDFLVELGSGRMVRGFEDQLLGLKSGEEKVFELTFPRDYQQTDLAGRTARFQVKVKEIAEPVLPHVDEKLAQSFGVKQGGVQAFRQELRHNMERELADKIRTRIKAQVMDGLMDLHGFDLPQALVHAEIKRLRKNAMETVGTTEEGRFPDEIFAEEARNRVALGLISGEIIKTQGLKPEPERVNAALAHVASSYESPEEVISYYRSNRQAMANIESVVLEDQVVAWVLSTAKVVDEPARFNDLMNEEKAES
jgi:trigger factor